MESERSQEREKWRGQIRKEKRRREEDRRKWGIWREKEMAKDLKRQTRMVKRKKNNVEKEKERKTRWRTELK